MGAERTVTLPDIGAYTDVPIIEVLVQPGETIAMEAPLITLESDKATMEIPSPAAGRVLRLMVAVGDKVSQGTPILVLDESAGESVAVTAATRAAPAAVTASARATTAVPAAQTTDPAAPPADPRAPAFYRNPPPAAPATAETVRGSETARAHASPSVRRFARELGVDLGLVYGRGPKGRILLDDVKSFTRAVLTRNKAAPGIAPALAAPPIDFSKFGPVESKPLTRIRRLSGQALQRSWSSIPHVTQFDEADITDLEDFRRSKLADAEQRGVRLTLLSFLLKAAVVALERYPEFSSSLSADGDALVLKKYFHIGVAVNTDQGLLVPVLRDVDQKGLMELALELRDLTVRARAGKLSPAEMQGGCFTISSLGGVGGTGFTPIINAPEVAILGVSRAAMRPVHRDGGFVPRLVLPYALSFDHRVIDGVAGAEFTQYLSTVLSDIRHILL